MGGLAAEKLFRPVTRRMGETKQIQLQTPDYDVDDEIRNWDELPFEGDEDEEEDPDYSLLEEDIPNDFPDSDDEVPPGEKPRRQSRPPKLPRPPEHPTPPPPPPPYSSPPPPYSSPPPRDSESIDLVTLNRFLNANKRRPNAVIANPKSKLSGGQIRAAGRYGNRSRRLSLSSKYPSGCGARGGRVTPLRMSLVCRTC